MWLLCNTVHYISDSCNLYPQGIKYRLPRGMQKYTMYIFLCVDDSDNQSMNKPVQRSPNKPKETKIKPVMLCAYSGYKASFEACFVDLEYLEEHNVSKTLFEYSRKHHSIAWFYVNGSVE